MEGSRRHWEIQEVRKVDGPEHSIPKQTRAKEEGDDMNCLYEGLLVYRKLGNASMICFIAAPCRLCPRRSSSSTRSVLDRTRPLQGVPLIARNCH